MLLSLIVPVNAAADPNYEIVMQATTTDGPYTFYEGQDGLRFNISIRGASVNGTQCLMLSVDSSKLELFPASGAISAEHSQIVYGNINEPLQIGYEGEDPVTLATGGNSWNSPSIYGTKTAVPGRTILVVMPDRNSPRASADLARVATIAFGFVGGTTIDDLDKGSITVLDPETLAGIDAIGETSSAYVAASPNKYAWGNKDGSEETLAKPTIIYPNSDVINLEKVTVTADQTNVNVPVTYPTAGADKAITVTTKAFDGGNDEITAGVTYTYGLNIKTADDTDFRALTEAEAATLQMDASGSVTVKAGAPAGTLRITAAGEYTNNKSAVSNAEGYADVTLTHGDPTADPSDPTYPVLSAVEIYEDDAKVTSSLTAAVPYEKAIARPESGNADPIEFTAVEVDQYGDAMTATGGWNSPTYAGVTFAAGVVTVSSAAVDTTAPIEYSYTAGAMTATVKLTISDIAINWPTLTNGAIVYGQPTTDLTYTGGSVSNSDGPVAATFNWKDAATLLNAGTTTATMVCSYGDADPQETVEKDYNVSVGKADQVITIDQDEDGQDPLTELEIELGETVTLNAKAVNKTVTTVDGNTPTYAETADANSLITLDETAGTIKGDKLSTADDADVATVTITAAGNDNYNEATRTLSVRVSNPMLRANISFGDYDTKAPEYNAEITATITEANNQTGSLTNDCKYQWGYMADADATEPTAITGANGNLSVTDGAATVTYTPGEDDIGKVLTLTVYTPDGAPTDSYIYIHHVSKTMTNAVEKATQVTPTAVTSDVTKDSITLKTVDSTTLSDAGNGNLQFAYRKAGDTTDFVYATAYSFTGLDANTDYEVAVKYVGNDTYKESGVYTTTIKTSKISITPADPENPTAGEASATLTGTAKYNETLTAQGIPGTDLPADLFNGATYVWKRTPVVESEPEAQAEGDETEPGIGTEPESTVIEGESGSTYQIKHAEDIGCIITVEISPASTSNYDGVVTASSDKVVKADGPDFTGENITTEKASSATAADGKIKGLENNVKYDYRLKVTEGSEPAAWSTAEHATEIDGLAAGVYELRISGTDTQEASNIIEREVEVNGYSITGKINSYNNKLETTFELYASDGAGGYAATPVAEIGTGTAIAAGATYDEYDADLTGDAAAAAAASRHTQNLLISNVPNGTYKLVIKKAAHITYTVLGVVVNDGNVNLTDHVGTISMAAGNVDKSDTVNGDDKNVLKDAANWWNTPSGTGWNPELDINGDDIINGDDVNIVVMTENWWVNETACTVNFSE